MFSESEIGKFLLNQYLGNTILDYIIFVVLFIAILLLIKPILKLISKINKKMAKNADNSFIIRLLTYLEEKRNKAFVPLEVIFALYIASRILWLTQKIQNIVDSLFVIFLTIFIVSIIIDFIKYFVKSKYDPTDSNNDPRANSLFLLMPIINVFIWVLAAFFILSNFGYDISTLLTGLGIGGVALALASQAFLSDLISFISIISDKPIEIGDYISIGGIEGTVLKIGIKSTRIERNLGEEVVIPNSKITSSDLFNYRRMNKRRFDITLGLSMDTPNEKIKMLPEIIKKICASEQLLDFQRANLIGANDFSLQYSIVCFVLDSNFAVFCKVRENLLFKLSEELSKNNIVLAYPTQEIIVKKQ
jgi:small-conductance mechanosensitive channel